MYFVSFLDFLSHLCKTRMSHCLLDRAVFLRPARNLSVKKLAADCHQDTFYRIPVGCL